MRDVIELSHSLNFDELDKVTILVLVALVFMDVHGGVLTLFDATDDILLCCFSVLVRDHEIVTIVQEGVAGKTQVLRENKTDSV